MFLILFSLFAETFPEIQTRLGQLFSNFDTLPDLVKHNDGVLLAMRENNENEIKALAVRMQHQYYRKQ